MLNGRVYAHPKNQLPSVARRMRAGQMLMAGEGIDSVARRLGISTASAKRYRAVVEVGGLDALENMAVGGRKSALDLEALEWIANSLRGSPTAIIFDSDQWTDGRLQSVIRNRLGIDFSRVYVRQITIDLGFADRLTARRNQTTIPSSPLLAPATLSWSAAALRHSPRVEGIDADRWTNERLRAAIESRLGIRSCWRGWNLHTSHLLVSGEANAGLRQTSLRLRSLGEQSSPDSSIASAN
jgi:transposase